MDQSTYGVIGIEIMFILRPKQRRLYADPGSDESVFAFRTCFKLIVDRANFLAFGYMVRATSGVAAVVR